jgi:2-methylcitrate dehydratase PrpD
VTEHNRDNLNPPRETRGLLTRRCLLQRASCMIATAVLSRTAMLGQDAVKSGGGPSISPVMAKLSAYMSAAQHHELPDEVVEKAKHHILDTFAAMVSGSELTPGREAIRFARAYGGEKIATVAASTVLCGPIEAAMANAELAHSDETDDYDPRNIGHPGSTIVPAALALGEQFGVSGTHFLRAVMLGYDVGLRAITTVGRGAAVKDIHIMLGTFGGGAAGGCVAGLSSQQMRWLLDYAAQQSTSGIPAWTRDTEHIEKAFVFAAAGARNGVTAALLVHSGWTGVDDILSGPDNFLQCYAPQADPTTLIDKLGERYDVERVNIKKWSVGGPIQPTLDALENLLKRHPLDPDQVQQIIVRIGTNGAGIVNNREMPDICLQHLIAVMLIDKTVSFRAAHDLARMRDPAILRQRAKVQLVPSEEFERLNPRRVAVVEITLNDGTQLSERVDAVRGTTENPMAREDVVAKARDLMSPILGEQACVKLITEVLGLENVKNIRELRPLLALSTRSRNSAGPGSPVQDSDLEA